MRLRFDATLTATLLAASLTILGGCKNDAPTLQSAPPPHVIVNKPVVREVTDYFEFPGRTEAVSEVLIRARVTGYIDKVDFEDGQGVKQGQTLFEIDPRPYKAVLDRLKGELTRLEAVQEKAQADLARSKRLLPSGAVSADEYEQHVAQLKIARAWLDSARAAVVEAELNLEFTKIISPINGRVSSARIREGNLVQSGNGDSAVLTTVVTTDPIYVSFDVDEQALLKYEELAFRTGQVLHPRRLKDLKIPIEIGLADEEGFPHKGVLDFADNKIDRGTGTIRVRGVFDNTKEYLTPGLFVRVRIPFGDPHKALLIPERAIERDQRERYVLTVDKNNIVERRSVKIGPLRDGLRVIESGISADDRVIVDGLLRARPDKPVNPQMEKEHVAATSPSASGAKEAKKAGGSATKN